MTAPPTIQTNPLDPVFSGVPVVISQGNLVNPTWNKWFVDLREKVNVINSTLAAWSGITPVTGLTPGTYGDTTHYPIVTVNEFGLVTDITEQSVGGGGAPMTVTAISAVSYTIPLTAAPSTSSNRGWIAQSYGSANTVEVDINANVAFPVGTDIFISQEGTGATTIKALKGVIFTGQPITGAGQYAVGRITQLALNNWRVTGNLAYQVFVDYASTILADTPTAYWHLGEPSGTSAVDSSGNGYTGTYSGTYTQGQPSILPNGYGNSLLLAGAGYVVTPSTPGLAGISAPVSLEAWLYLTSIPGGNAVVIGISYIGPQLAISSTTAGKLTFGYSGQVNGTESSGAVTANTKTHVVATVSSSGAITYYINGVSAGTGTVAVYTGSGVGNIGRYMHLGNFYLSGSVQEVAVYNYALTPSQVLSHYNAGN